MRSVAKCVDQTAAAALAYAMLESTMSAYFPAITYTVQRRRPRLAPMIAGVALGAISFAGKTRLGAWLCGYFGGSRCGREKVSIGEQFVSVGDCLAFGKVREWLLGRDRAMIVYAFGPPGLMETGEAAVYAVADAGAGSFWRSAIWYYPIDPAARTAMAIWFAGGVVRQVDFFELAATVGG